MPPPRHPLENRPAAPEGAGRGAWGVQKWRNLCLLCVALAVLLGPGLYYTWPLIPQPHHPIGAQVAGYLQHVLTRYGPLACGVLAFHCAQSALNEIDRCLTPSTGIIVAEFIRGLALALAAASLLWLLLLSYVI